MRYRPVWMTLVILLSHVIPPWAQSWTPVDPQTIPITSIREIIPQTCVTYQMDFQTMKSILWTAPYDYVQQAGTSNTLIMVGLADGSADYFRMVQYEMMEAPLAAKYVDIKTFRGVSVSNPYRTIRADWTKNGFRAVISDLGGKTYIDPFQRNDMSHRVVYYVNTYSRETDWSCGTTESDLWEGDHDNDHEIDRAIGDCEFRSYRLALATTGEYSNFFGATSPAQSAIVMGQVVTAVNRVNEVYEKDFATRLILVVNTDDVFYYDGGNDPYNNGNGSTMLGQNQANLDANIGSSNYDIGHVFSTGGGGVAYLNAVCDNAIKAGGVTGSSNPVGDPFTIDYVAHEMGHQFGALHTQNNNCNRNLSSSMEPGSASTIMGYAGICAPNVQPNSDDYMHAISLQQINNRISSSGCELVISTDNSPPVVSNVPNFIIPISTPFVLTAVAVDDDDDPMTYCWEQWDPEVGAMPPVSTNAVGPMFRSIDPTSSPSRYFPNIAAVINGTNPTWEVLPSVTRDMEFRVTVRELFDGMYGCTDEDNTLISTTASAGPFIVTSYNSLDTLYEDSTATITWNVANTNASPVNCANVDIRLSYDGGFTYPALLAQNEPNDGSAIVSLPIGTTTTGRIMVKGANNVFFDINNANFVISMNAPNFTLNLNPSSVTECNDGSVETIVEVGQMLGFSDPVTLTMLNLPPGATVSFMPPVVTPGSNSTLTISNLTGLFGIYSPTVRASSTTGSKDSIFTITLQAPLSTSPTLTAPANNTMDALITPILDWQPVSGVPQYEFQLAYDNAFAQIAQTGTSFIDQYHITTPLIVGQKYYWRVRGINSCGPGTWSQTFLFTTSSCFALLSSDVPVIIPAGVTSTVYSDFWVPVDMVISDVNVINLMGTHTWVNDLRFSLISPDAGERLIWNRPCSNHDNFNINFDDEASPGNPPCPPTDGLFYRPFNNLNYFDGKDALGLWQMKVQDLEEESGGSLNSWGLKVCGTINCQLTVNKTSGTGTGSLPAAIACANEGDTIRLGAMLTGQTINVGSAPLLLDKDLVILAENPVINVTVSGDRIFEIANGVEVELINVLMTAGVSMTGAAINNAGLLRLKDVNIESSIASMGATLVHNQPGGQMFVNGMCTLNQ